MQEQVLSLFSYGTLRKDYYNNDPDRTQTIDKNGNKWSDDVWGVTKEVDCVHGYVKGFELLQDKEKFYPFVIKKPGNSQNIVFGCFLTWSSEQFADALRVCNNIEGYHEGEGSNNNMYDRTTTTVYKDEKCTIMIGKAYIYYQNISEKILQEKSDEYYRKISPDWFKFPKSS